VKAALEAAEGNGEVPDGVDLEVGYVGSPEYRIKVRAPNYKTAEDQLEAAAARPPARPSRPPAAPVGSTATATRTTSSRSRSAFYTLHLRNP